MDSILSWSLSDETVCLEVEPVHYDVATNIHVPTNIYVPHLDSEFTEQNCIDLDSLVGRALIR